MFFYDMFSKQLYANTVVEIEVSALIDSNTINPKFLISVLFVRH